MIEIDIISGFLGAGKTTLANRLMARYASQGERVVYIVNEFGQTDMDAELLRGAGFEAVALEGGCACCTLKGELTRALGEIVRTFSPERIVFETSGVFVFSQFEDVLKDGYLRERCAIRRAVVVADSLNCRGARLIAGSFIENQIRNASVLVLSKLERFRGDPEELICDLRNINPHAALVALPWSESGFLDAVLRAQQGGMNGPQMHAHAHLDTVTVKAGRDYARGDVERITHCVTSGECGEVLRAKGSLRMDGVPHLLNIAMEDVVLERAAVPGEPCLTFIGAHLDASRLESLLA